MALNTAFRPGSVTCLETGNAHNYLPFLEAVYAPSPPVHPQAIESMKFFPRSVYWSRRPSATLLTLLLVLGTSPVARAQLQVAAPRLVAESTDDIFPLPEELKTAEDCFKFIEEIASTEPADESEEAMIALQRKLARSVVLATDKALSLEPNDKEAMQAYFFKIQALGLLNELNEPGVAKRFDEAIAAARDDSRPDVQAVGMKYFVESGFGKWPASSEQEKTALMAEIVKFLQQGKPSVSQLRTLLTVVQFLEAMQDEQFAKPMLAELIPHFQASEDETIQEVVKKLEGMYRRLDLLGHNIQLTGTLLDGSEFDWKSYRGKVVLVDFWATWCQPCRQEVPNVLKLYKAYHEKGFDVVGISLDESRDQAESYIKQYDIPWPNLFSGNEDEHGWDHPLAVYYGITGIPRAILVDREGTVVSLQARGKLLARDLRKLLGEPVAHSSTVEDSLAKQVDASVPAE